MGVIEIELYSQQVKIGDELIFENQTDLFYRHTITSMQFDQKPIDETPSASAENHILISMKVDRPLPRNANVYLYSINEK